MTKAPSSDVATELENEAHRDGEGVAPLSPTGVAPPTDTVAAARREPPTASEPVLATASHAILFQTVEPTACDACNALLTEADDEDGFGVLGSGVYMWTRGDAVRFERAPLCASCASAIGMTALARWEIEEEEG